MSRRWPHLVGLALWVGAFAFGYVRLSGRLPFWSAVHEATVVPLWAGFVLGPVTTVVLAVSVGCGIRGSAARNRAFTVVMYTIPAAYWCFLAEMMIDLDL